MGFGRQVGWERRPKIEQKSIQKCIEQNNEKNERQVRDLGGSTVGRALEGQRSWAPLNDNFKETNTQPNTLTISHALRAEARWRIYP